MDPKPIPDELIAERKRLSAAFDRVKKRLEDLNAQIDAHLGQAVQQQQQQPQAKPPSDYETPSGQAVMRASINAAIRQLETYLALLRDKPTAQPDHIARTTKIIAELRKEAQELDSAQGG